MAKNNPEKRSTWQILTGAGSGRKGIPGLTAPRGLPSGLEEGAQENGDLNKRPGKAVNMLTEIPKAVLTTGVQAVAAGVFLGVGRKIGIRDPMIPKPEKPVKKGKVGKEKGSNDGKGGTSGNEGQSWSERIEQVVHDFGESRRDENLLAENTRRRVGPEDSRRLDRMLDIGQRTDVDTIPASQKEIQYAQQLAAEYSENDPDLDTFVNNKVMTLAIQNLIKVGKLIADEDEARALDKMKSMSSFTISHMDFWNGFLAVLAGAWGGQGGSMRGGYEVSLNEGQLRYRVGQDTNNIDEPSRVTVDSDIPAWIESAMSVAKGETKFLVGYRGWFRNLLKKMIRMDESGDVPLLPGTLKIQKTGGGRDEAVYPVLNVKTHMDAINRIRVAGEKLAQRMEHLSAIDLDENESELKRRLFLSALEGAQMIPRASVVKNYIRKFVDVEAIDKKREMRQIKLDLEKAGIQNMDPRTARNIIGYKYDFATKLNRKFGTDEGRRLMVVLLNEAEKAVLAEKKKK